MDAHFHCELGFQAWQEWRLEDAIRQFNLAIKLAPNFGPAYTGRGYVNHREGRYEAAIEDFSHAIKLDAADSDAWMGRADTFQIIARFDDAMEDYSEAIRLHPHVAQYFHRRADAYSAVGNAEMAIRDYRSAISLEPENPVSHYLLAACLADREAYFYAIKHYREAIRIDPDNLDSFVYYGYAWILATCPDASSRDPEEAIRIANIACENEDWCDEQSLGVLAAAYAAAANFVEAERLQRRALELAEEGRREIHFQRFELYQSGKPLVATSSP